jgi:hypothetical protein
MSKHEKEQLVDRSIVVDGSEYVGCTFVRCEIIFAGGSLPVLANNSFRDCRWVFDGPSARTIQFMAALYRNGAKDLIEATFENIRGKPAGGLTLH